MSKPAEVPQPTNFTDIDKSNARQWFKKAASLRDQRNYDFAIEAIITGLGFWPEAVEEGHMPLHAIALQRSQAGGKKPGMLDTMRTPITGKDHKQCMLNAERLFAKDPANASYVDAMLQNAAKAGFEHTVRWVAPRVLESMRRDKKPHMSRFRAYKQALVEIGDRADARGDAQTAAWCFESAVQGIEYLMGQNPGDMGLKDEQRELTGKLIIAKGKYSDGGTFRDSLQDAEGQKRIYDAERMKQGETSLVAMIAAARKDYEANPNVVGKVIAYADALLKSEKKVDEDGAIDVLEEAYARTDNYSFKLKADDIRLRQLARESRKLRERAKASGSDEDQQQARLAEMEERQTELEVYRERIQKYPTDLKMKFKLGSALMNGGEFDEAIPLLQAAQADPRTKSLCNLLIGQGFLQKDAPEDAAEVLKDAAESHDPPGDETWKKLVYWLARALEAAGRSEDAVVWYGKLLRVDYGYAEGEARKRMDALKQRVKGHSGDVRS